jgi:hypothetical protein
MSVASASYAQSASYAATATSASYAPNATTSSYSNTATSASYANSASYADTSISASYAVNSTSASYAAAATSASYAVDATSASYAAAATSASYAVDATSASYALTSSNIEGGTANYIPLWLSNTKLTSSIIYQSGSKISINTASVAGNGTLQVYSATDDNHFQAYGSAPSLRLTNLATGATINGVVGMATGTNNYIIGSVAGDMVINNTLNSTLILATDNTERLRITGSRITVPGSITATSFTGSFSGTSSFAVSASQAFSSSYALTASYAMNGGSSGVSAIYIADEGTQIGTSSFFNFIGAGVTSTITDGTASINIPGGGGGGQSGGNAILDQTVAATTWSFTHNLSTLFPVFQVFDSNNDVIIPQAISAENTSSALIYFSTPRTGTAVATIGGDIVSASYALVAVSSSYANSASYSATAISASYALNVTSASYAVASTSASYANSSSFALYAQTASYAINPVISGSINNVNYIDFNTSATVTQPVAGRLSWNNTDGTLDLGMKGGNVTQQIGQEIFYEIRNETTSSILNGTSLYANGVTAGSGRITAAPFVADGNTREVRYLGLATEDISNGVNGFVTHFGYVRDLDTRGTNPSSIAVGDENWAVGDILYAHPTVAGKLTNVKPKHEISVAIIIIRHQSTGVLFVRPASYGHIDDIHDVNINTGSLSTGDLLIYDSGSDYWTNSKQLSGSYGLTGSLNATSFTGSLLGTASFATSASYALDATTASYALTASSADSFTVRGTLTAQQLNVQTITSSIIYSSGSNIFGNDLTNTQILTGSVSITGSLAVNGSNVIVSNQTGSMSVATASYALTASYASNVPATSSFAISASQAETASYALTASYSLSGTGFPFSGSAVITGSLLVSGSGITGSLEGTASYALTASYAANVPATSSFAISASQALSSSYAISASFATYANNAPGFTVQFSQSSAATTWSFTHNLNTRNPIVQVYDTDYKQIIPNDIVGTGVNTAEIRFDYAQAGYVVMSNGGGLYVTGSTSELVQTVGATTWSFTHNLNSKYVNFEVYDSNDYVIIPAGIRVLTTNTAELYFAYAQTGRAVAQFSGINGAPNATTASYALTATSASYALNTTTASYAVNATSASFTTTAITASYLNPITDSYVVLTQVSQSLNFADDAAAAAGGVPLGGLYRNGNFILIRIS